MGCRRAATYANCNSWCRCPGHFGHIQLILPVFHIGFIKHIASILNCVCKQCSKLLLSADDKAKILTAQRSSKCDQNMRIMLLKRVVEICKKTQMCPSCGESNFLVKKVRGQLRLVHDRNVKSKAASANFVSLRGCGQGNARDGEYGGQASGGNGSVAIADTVPQYQQRGLRGESSSLRAPSSRNIHCIFRLGFKGLTTPPAAA